MIPRLKTSLLAILLTTSLPLAAMLLFCWFSWSRSEQTTAQERDATHAVELTLTMKAMIEEGRRAMTAVAADPSVTWTRGATLDARLSVFQDLFPYSSGISAISPKGIPLAPARVRQLKIDLTQRDWFKRVHEANKFVVGEFVISALSGAAILPMALPVKHGDSVLAILAMSIDLSWFYDRAQFRTLPPGSTINFIGADKSVLLRYPDPQQYVGGPFDRSSLVLDAASAHKVVTAEYVGLDGLERLYFIEPLQIDSGFLGSVAIGIPVSQIHQSTSLALTLTLIIFAVVALLTTWTSVTGLRNLVLHPIRLLTNHAQELAGGTFAARVSTEKLPSELKVLGDSVNVMAEALQARDAELSQYRDHLEETVEERTKELQASRVELERSNGELQQFAYVASHDLQEPLRMVASFTQLLSQKYAGSLDDQAQQYIGFAVDGATRMQHLINDLLAYSRIQTQARAPGAVEATDCLGIALGDLGARIKETGAQVFREPLPRVLADPIQLSQVFLNLVGNAIKFNRSPKPGVWVTAQTDEGKAVIRVEDDGIGISPEFSERVFVIFQRLNPRSEFPGTGIGLALCKRIIERNGGTIWFEPSSHGGTCFAFTLPLPEGGPLG